MKFWLRSLLTHTLITLLALGPGVARVPNVQAAEPETALEFSSTPPEGGFLDNNHQAKPGVDSHEYSLLAIRNVVLLDSLQTRIQLFEWLGRGPTTNEILPQTLEDLFSPRAGKPGVPEFSALIARLKHGSYARGSRENLIRTLIHLSTRVAQLDMAIKFLMHDYWKDSLIHQTFYDDYVWPIARQGIDSDGNLKITGLRDPKTLQDRMQKEWFRSSGVSQIVAQLAGYRERMLSDFSLLGIPIQKRPLYQYVYEALQSTPVLDPLGTSSEDPDEVPPKIPFPSTQAIQKAIENAFRADRVPQIPKRFGQEVLAAMDALGYWLEGGGSDTGSEYLSTIESKINVHLAAALNTALKHNTKQIQSLLNPASLLDLAGSEKLWKDALRKYIYLSEDGSIDFVAGYEAARAELARNAKRQRTITYIWYGTGFVLMAGAAVTGLLEIQLGGWAVAQALTAASGVPFSVGAVYEYVNAQEVADVQRNLYLGTSRSGDYGAYQEKVRLEEEAAKIAIYTVMISFADVAILVGAGKLFTAAKWGLEVAYVEASKDRFGKMLGGLTRLGRSMEVLPIGRALLRATQKVADKAAAVKNLMSFDGALAAAAKILRKTPAELEKKILAMPGVGPVIEGSRAAIQADPTFLTQLMRNEVNSVGLTLYFEIDGRGEKWKEQTPLIAGSVISQAVGTLVSTFAFAGKAQPKLLFDPKLSGKDRFRGFAETAKSNGGVAFLGALFGQGLGTGFDLLTNPDSLPMSSHLERTAKTAAWSTVFAMTHKNLRDHIRYTYLELSKSAHKSIVFDQLGYRSSIIGGWHYVAGAQAIGALPSETAKIDYPDTEGYYVKIVEPAVVEPTPDYWAVAAIR